VEKENMNVGDLVLIKEKNISPTHWPLGRVKDIIKGNDKKVRVVNIQTQNQKEVQRNVREICTLMTNEELQRPNDVENTNSLSNVSLTKENGDVKENEKLNNKSRLYTAGRKSCIARSCYFFLMMLILCCSSVKGLIEVINSPIYFDKLGETSVVNSEWRLVVYYELNGYNGRMKQINYYLVTLNGLCKTMDEYQDYCKAIISSLENNYKKLKENEVLLKDIHSPYEEESPRKRRSPFDFVGSLAHALFGVLDADYAKELEKNIILIKANEQQQKRMIQNQTSIVDSTLNVLTATEDHVNSQFEILGKQLNTLTDEVVKGTNKLKFALIFQFITTQINLVLADCEKFQQNVEEVLTDIHHSRINPNLVTVAQLNKEIKVIKENLLPRTKILMPLRQLYRFMTAEGAVTESCIIIELKIPIIRDLKFDLMKVIPVPLVKNERLVMAETSIQNFVINIAEGLMFETSNSQLRSCIEIKQREFVCHENQPLMKIDLIKGNCELDTFSHRFGEGSCKFIEVARKVFWHRLSNNNEWLFSTYDTERIQVECDGDFSVSSIKGQGVLRLNRGCTVRQSEIMLIATKNNILKTKGKLFSNVLPEFSIGNESIKPLHYHATILNNSKLINEVKARLSTIEKESSNDWLHVYTTSYTSLGLIVICLIVAFIWWRYHKYKESQQPVPVSIPMIDFLRKRNSVHLSG
jgi:hypothetical protein